MQAHKADNEKEDIPEHLLRENEYFPITVPALPAVYK